MIPADLELAALPRGVTVVSVVVTPEGSGAAEHRFQLRRGVEVLVEVGTLREVTAAIAALD